MNQKASGTGNQSRVARESARMWPGGPTWTDPVDPNALTLSMLPLDVLRCVLVQSY